MDAGTAELAAVEFCRGVVADGANVMSAQAPPLAGDQRRSDLAAGHDLGAEHFELGAEGGELGKLEHGVGGVFADAEDIEKFGAHRVVVQGIGREEKCKAR